MASVVLWVPGWNSQYTHDHIQTKLGMDVVPVPVRNCSHEQHERDDYLREYHADITEICDDIDAALIGLPGTYERIILYGHSRGGFAALLYCVFGANRHRVSALILNDPMMNLGRRTALLPCLMNVHPRCWKLSFPYVTLRPKVDVTHTFGKANDDFVQMSMLVAPRPFKTRQTGGFSDQLIGFLWWFDWLRRSKCRVATPTYALLATHDDTVDTEDAFARLNAICLDAVIERCPFCTHDVLLFDGMLVDKIVSRIECFLEHAGNKPAALEPAALEPAALEPARDQTRYILWFPTILVYVLLGLAILSLRT